MVVAQFLTQQIPTMTLKLKRLYILYGKNLYKENEREAIRSLLERHNAEPVYLK